MITKLSSGLVLLGALVAGAVGFSSSSPETAAKSGCCGTKAGCCAKGCCEGCPDCKCEKECCNDCANGCNCQCDAQQCDSQKSAQ